ncbi:MAG: hypothetical protein ABR498_03580 [Candidatus Dormibacteria bacterium]
MGNTATAERQREPTIAWSVFVQIVMWVVASLITYSALNARVGVIEARVDDMKSDIGEIKTDVKQLLLHTVKP